MFEPLERFIVLAGNMDDHRHSPDVTSLYKSLVMSSGAIKSLHVFLSMINTRLGSKLQAAWS